MVKELRRMGFAVVTATEGAKDSIWGPIWAETSHGCWAAKARGAEVARGEV